MIDDDGSRTAVTWDRFEAFHATVRTQRRRTRLAATGLPGPSRRGSRMSTLTARRVYLHVQRARARPDGSSSNGGLIKTRASDALIAAGRERSRIITRVGRDHTPGTASSGSLFGKALDAAKSALDPAGIMNPGVPRARSAPSRARAAYASTLSRFRPWTPTASQPRLGSPSHGSGQAIAGELRSAPGRGGPLRLDPTLVASRRRP